jgi:hypothetical protein
LGNLKELGKSDLYVLEDIFLDGVENWTVFLFTSSFI